VTLSAAEDALGWSISVEDDGPGLPAELQAAAGTRFARGRGRAGPGSGLGLAIARSIAGRHGGVLRLEPPEAGSGLRATLWWPRTPGIGGAA
jgi:two-component system sensor histidine kinase TctE